MPRCLLQYLLTSAQIAMACSCTLLFEPSDAGSGSDGANDTGPAAIAEYTFDEIRFDSGRALIADSSRSATSHDLLFGTGDDLLVTLGCTEQSVFLNLPEGRDIELQAPAVPQDIIDACTSSDELTVEAWVRPANSTQGGPARIVTLSSSVRAEAFLLGQSGNQIAVRVRAGQDVDAEAGLEFATGALQHIALVAGQSSYQVWEDGRTLATGSYSGTFSTWNELDAPLLGVANHPSTDSRPWAGELHHLAIYCRKLTDEVLAARPLTGPPADSADAVASLCPSDP